MRKVILVVVALAFFLFILFAVPAVNATELRIGINFEELLPIEYQSNGESFGVYFSPETTELYYSSGPIEDGGYPLYRGTWRERERGYRQYGYWYWQNGPRRVDVNIAIPLYRADRGNQRIYIMQYWPTGPYFMPHPEYAPTRWSVYYSHRAGLGLSLSLGALYYDFVYTRGHRHGHYKARPSWKFHPAPSRHHRRHDYYYRAPATRAHDYEHRRRDGGYRHHEGNKIYKLPSYDKRNRRDHRR